MADFVGSSNMSKMQHLAIALKDVLQRFPQIRIVPFASMVKEIKDPKDLPSPDDVNNNLGGGTDLAAALNFIQKHKPRRTIIISDGLPNSEIHAQQAADQITGGIDTIYCGPDEHPAVKFLAGLAKSAGGASYVWNGYTELGATLRKLLPAPAAESTIIL